MATGTFLAAAVEFVETFTIVLAVGVARSWQVGPRGPGVALLALTTVTAVARVTLIDWDSESLLQLVIGTLLLIFGLGWLRKAILRSVGLVALHDEEEAFRAQQEVVHHSTPCSVPTASATLFRHMAALFPVRDPIFQVEHLSLAYPAPRGHPMVPILKDVSVEVERGGALTLVGPSGSGKSTLLRCLNRLAEPTAGTVRFDGRDIRSLDPRELRRWAALVMQTPVLFEGTVRDNLRIRPAGTQGDFSEGRLGDTLTEVGLDPGFLDLDAATLSGGEKQRVTIARALLRDPQVLLLDEPTSALDPPNVALVVETISRLRDARRLSIVAVTHQPELVRRLGGCLLYLVKGQVQVHECIDGVASHSVTDARLQAFLAGERPPAVTSQM